MTNPTRNRGVYEPHAGHQDDPAVSQADMDPTKKEAATLADGTGQEHANVRKTATRANGPDVKGVKVAADEDQDEDEDIKASKAARDLAEENGIDLSTIEGTGQNGSITKGDVEKAIAAQDEGQE